jgi:polysaccharide deacetylase family protein (PEP-CTERM system associated)
MTKTHVQIKNILTIDVEDWFHVCGQDHVFPERARPCLESRVAENTRKILDLLSPREVKATFFVLGSVAEDHPGLIEEIAKGGHEIATHGYSHRRVYEMSMESFREDLLRSASILSGITGRPVKGFRAPEWSISKGAMWALDVLQQEGFLYDSSLAPLWIIGRQDHPRTPCRLTTEKGLLCEFPPLVRSTRLVNLPLGGGWGLRLFPYRLIRSTIRRMNEQGHPATLFFHPREFDPGGPRPGLSRLMRFVLYARLRETVPRFIRLLEDFPFSTMSESMGRISDD